MNKSISIKKVKETPNSRYLRLCRAGFLAISYGSGSHHHQVLALEYTTTDHYKQAMSVVQQEGSINGHCK